MSGYKNKTGNIGPCQIVWDPLGTPKNLGPFLGVEWKLKENVEPVLQDPFGKTAVDYVTVGADNLILTASMASASGADDTDDRLALIQHITKSTDQYSYTTSCGESQRDFAKLVYIKPMINNAVVADDAQWTQILVCTPPLLDLTQVYDAKGQRVWKIEMRGLPSFATGQVGEVVIWGKN